MLTDTWPKNGQMNTWNYTNSDNYLAMTVICLPVKFEFIFLDKAFAGNSPETEMLMDTQTDKKWTNEQTELHKF